MVYSIGLLNRRGLKSSGGSNPSLSVCFTLSYLFGQSGHSQRVCLVPYNKVGLIGGSQRDYVIL